MRKRDTLGILAVVAFLSVPINLFGSQSAGECSSLLSEAQKKFYSADFQGALVNLHALVEQSSLLDKCPLSDKEKAYFYHSYCHFLLNACNNPETADAIQLFKINCPEFDADFASKMAQPDYSWVSQSWKDCYQNIKPPIDKIIDNHYQSGKNLILREADAIAAVQKFVAVIKLIESYDTAGKFGQVLNDSRGFIILCQKDLISKWRDLADHNDYEGLKALKDTILSIDKHDVYLKDLVALFESPGTHNIWSDLQDRLASLINEQELIYADFGALKEQLAKVRRAKAAGLGLASLNVDDYIIGSFRAYAEHIGKLYYINQEDEAKKALEAYRQFIVTNCPNSAASAQKIYDETLSTAPVYDFNFIGVKPPAPKKGKDHKITPPSCVQKSGISGKVTLIIKVDPEGRVVSVDILTNGYRLNKNKDDDCVQSYLKVIMNGVKNESFMPAFKERNRPATAAFTRNPDQLAANNRIPVAFITTVIYTLQ